MSREKQDVVKHFVDILTLPRSLSLLQINTSKRK